MNKRYSVNNRIRVARAEHRVTQKALAKTVGVSEPYINHVENGSATPSIAIALRIGKALGKTVDELFYEED